jgi:hypothetical protein
LTKLVLSFGENQMNILFDGLLFGNNETKQVLLQLIELIMVKDCFVQFNYFELLSILIIN